MKSLLASLGAAAALLLGSCLAGCAPSTAATPAVDMSTVQSDLKTVASARVLFAHQSVGRNILDGVRTLSAEAGVPVRIEAIADGKPLPPGPGLFHAYIGENGNGAGKIAAFQRMVLDRQQPAYDLALLKFCYADLASDAQERERVLDRYLSTITTLREQRPQVQLLHATVPLRATPQGWKTTLKRLLGRDEEERLEDADNAFRNRYNATLRTRIAGEPVFDVASVESTHADGTRSRFDLDGASFYSLAPEYTTDGGHLNAQGQRVVAAAFLHSLATALKQQQQPPQQRPG
jgi:lysophospholipase L1-like esterase